MLAHTDYKKYFVPTTHCVSPALQEHPLGCACPNIGGEDSTQTVLALLTRAA